MVAAQGPSAIVDIGIAQQLDAGTLAGGMEQRTGWRALDAPGGMGDDGRNDRLVLVHQQARRRGR